jgi:hypothetical protein
MVADLWKARRLIILFVVAFVITILQTALLVIAAPWSKTRSETAYYSARGCLFHKSWHEWETVGLTFSESLGCIAVRFEPFSFASSRSFWHYDYDRCYREGNYRNVLPSWLKAHEDVRNDAMGETDMLVLCGVGWPCIAFEGQYICKRGTSGWNGPSTPAGITTVSRGLLVRPVLESGPIQSIVIPLSPRPLGLALNILTHFAILLTVIVVPTVGVRAWRTHRGRCPFCGYITAKRTRCTECGRTAMGTFRSTIDS